MIKRLIVFTLSLVLIASPTYGATKKPTPTSTLKTTAKATAKPAPKPTATKKKVVTKKKKKVVPKKKVSLSPSPKPAWPPAGFKANGEIYAKIPSSIDMIGIVSASKSLSSQLAQKVDGVPVCEKYTCGVVQVASLNGCIWWEVTANVIGPVSATDKTTKIYGKIRTTIVQSAPKAIVTVLLVSQEPLKLKHSISNIGAYGHHDATTEKIPSNTYQDSTN